MTPLIDDAYNCQLGFPKEECEIAENRRDENRLYDDRFVYFSTNSCRHSSSLHTFHGGAKTETAFNVENKQKDMHQHS